MSLYIAAWRNLATVNGQTAPIVHGHPVFEGVVTVGAGSTQSQAVTDASAKPGGYYVRLRADEACHIAIGANPTATTGNTLKLGAGSVEWVGVPNGHKIAVIAGT